MSTGMLTSRRRRALLHHGAEPWCRQGLSAADIEMLQRDRSPAVRARIAAVFGRQLDELAAGADHHAIETMLQLLVRDPAPEVRRALALAVAASPSLPAEVARRLAADEIEIARPILQHSPIFADEDLIRIVRTRAKPYAIAVAGRARLSDTVARALIATGQEQVVAALIANVGTDLSEAMLRQVVMDFRASNEVQAHLLRRPELPPDLVEQLVASVGARLNWPLVQERRMSAAEARSFMDASRTRAAIGLAAPSLAERSLLQRLADRFAVGELGHEDLLRFLRDGDLVGLEFGLSLHAQLEPGHVRRLLYHPERQRLAALCITAGLVSTHHIILRLVFDAAEAALSPGYGGGALTVSFLHVQYEALRADEPRLRMLLGP